MVAEQAAHGVLERLGVGDRGGPGEPDQGRVVRSGAELVVLLETRLASLVLRSGLATSIYAARQFVTHGHITVDGRKVNIPSYLVKPGQVIAVREKSRGMQPFVAAAEGTYADDRVAAYLDVNHAELRFTVLGRPLREQIVVPVDEQLVVEFYSR